MEVLQEPMIDSELDTIEGADGRFFDAAEMHMRTDKFWQEHADLLPNDYGTVIQMGAMSDGSWTSLYNHCRESTYTLNLDARKRKAGAYTWQLTKADIGGGDMTITELEVTRPGLRAIKYMFRNSQGLSGIETADSDEVMRRIDGILRLPDLQARIADIRKTRSIQESHLSRFIVEKIAVYHEEKFKKELKKEQEIVNNVGFEAAKPFIPTESQRQILRTREENMKRWLDSVNLHKKS